MNNSVLIYPLKEVREALEALRKEGELPTSREARSRAVALASVDQLEKLFTEPVALGAPACEWVARMLIDLAEMYVVSHELSVLQLQPVVLFICQFRHESE